MDTWLEGEVWGRTFRAGNHHHTRVLEDFTGVGSVRQINSFGYPPKIKSIRHNDNSTQIILEAEQSLV